MYIVCFAIFNLIDVLIVRMAQISQLHCIGVLVIDEIQHLSLAKGGGQEKMLNFFVMLVNTIGVPVVLIGTNRPMTVLQSDFRQARRGSAIFFKLTYTNINVFIYNIIVTQYIYYFKA